MTIGVSPAFASALIGGILLAGALTGIAGFGFAIIGTMALAIVIEPATAVVFMIIPILAVNLSLIRELSPGELRSCLRRFGLLIVAALLGTLIGLLVLESLPQSPLRVLLGLLSLGFVATVQNTISLPGRDAVEDRCFVESRTAMIGIGGVSGILFGGTNVGVQLIAYLRSCDLSHSVFIGVVAMVFLGLNGIRIVAAALLGMYPDPRIAGLSVLAAAPALIGVAVGRRFRQRVGTRERRVVVLGLLTLIGIRLILGGLGIT